MRVNISRGQVDGTVPSVEEAVIRHHIRGHYGYKVGSVTELNNVMSAGCYFSKAAKGTVLSAGSVNLQVSLGLSLANLKWSTFAEREEAEMIIESLS